MGSDTSGLRVCITASSTSETVKASLLLKDEFKDSLFRKELDIEMEKRKSSETRTLIGTIDLWFDRTGFTLPIIVNVMRGYDYSKHSLSELEESLVREDCEFYGLPSVVDALFPSEETKEEDPFPVLYHKLVSLPPVFPVFKCDRKFQTSLMDGSKLRVYNDGYTAETTLARVKTSVGTNHHFTEGQHSMRFTIDCGGTVMFGVVPVPDFKTDLEFCRWTNMTGYHAFHGYITSRKTVFHGKYQSGQVIGISVNIDKKHSISEITFWKNGVVMGTESVPQFCHSDTPLMFAVSLCSSIVSIVRD